MVRVKKINIRRLWFIGGLGIIGLLWTLSLIPGVPTVGFRYEDKLQHLAAYGGTVWWWGQYWPTFRQRLVLAIGATLMGVGIEYVQRWTGWRTFDVMDMVANGFGVLLGWLAVVTPIGTLLSRVTEWQRQ